MLNKKIRNFFAFIGAIGIAGSVLVGIAYAAPTQIFQKSILPEVTDRYDLGSSTPAMYWNGLYVKTICLEGDTCRTTWPTGGGGGTIGWPFTPSTNFGVAVQATTTPEWFQNGLMASSTSYFVNATTSQFSIGTSFYGNPNDVLILGNATGTDATKIGRNTYAQKTNNIAIGTNANASGDSDVVAIGSTARVQQDSGIAVGKSASVTNTSNSYSIAVGRNASVAGSQSIAVGDSSSATGNTGVAIGSNSFSSATDGFALGASAGVNSSATGGIALGAQATVLSSVQYAMTLGWRSNATADYCMALGKDAECDDANNVVWGSDRADGTGFNMMIFGQGIESTISSPFTLKVTRALGSNKAGNNLNLIAGESTGSGVGGGFNFITSGSGAGASTVNSTSTKVAIAGDGTVTITNLNSANCDVKSTAGVLSCGTDATGATWPFTTTDTNYGVAVQSTTTPEWFKNGLFASSTSQIQFASTTAWSTTATSTGTSGINLSGGCFAISGTCLQTFIQNATAYKQAVNYATAAVLPGTPTYGNGASGVGATLTEVGFGALSVDGQAVVAGQRLLIKDQVDQTTNGVYLVSAPGSGIASYVLTRTTDYDETTDVYAGTTIPVLAGGTANADTQWTETTTGTIVMGTSNIAFEETALGTNVPTSVSNADGTLTISPTVGAVVASIALGHANQWTASTTITKVLNLQNASSSLNTLGTVWIPSITSALLLNDSAGKATAYGGATSCGANNFFTGLSAVGASTCGNSTIGATSPNSTLSFGSAAAFGATFTGDLNLANSNTWTGTQNTSSSATTTNAGGYYATRIAAPYFNATSTAATSTFMGGVSFPAFSLNGTILSSVASPLTTTNGQLGCATCLTSAAADAFTHPTTARSATSTAIEFTNGIIALASSTLGFPSATTTILGPLMVGNTAANGTMLGSTTMLQISTSTNSFLQALLWNTNTGSNASTELVFNNNLSTNLSYYGSIGINGGNYANGLYTGDRTNDLFLSSSDAGIDIELASTTATDATSSIDFLTKGTLAANLRFRISNTGLLMAGTSTPSWGQFTLASSTGPQLTLSDTNAANNSWAFRANGNNLYVSTTTAVVNGTSSTPILTLSSNFGVGIASSSPQISGLTIGWGNLIMTSGQIASAWASTTAASALPTISRVVDWNQGNNYWIDATGTLSLQINATSSHPQDGAHYILQVCQDSTGGRAVTFDLFSSGYLFFSMGTPTPPTTAGTGYAYGMVYRKTLRQNNGGYLVLAATSTPFNTCP